MAVAASLAVAGWLGWDRAELARRLGEAQRPVVVSAPAPLATAAPLAPVPPSPVPVPTAKDDTAERTLQAEVQRLRESLASAAQSGEADRRQLEAERRRLETAAAEANERAQRAEVRAASAEQARAEKTVARETAPPSADPRLAAELAKTREELADARRAAEVHSKQVAEYRRVFRALEGASLRHVDLRSVDIGGGRATARALYSAESGLVLFARDLPRLPANKCYQLWIVRKGGPAIVSGGLVQTDAQGRGVLFTGASESLKDATGFAITDEPEGGSVSARGRKLLFGAL